MYWSYTIDIKHISQYNMDILCELSEAITNFANDTNHLRKQIAPIQEEPQLLKEYFVLFKYTNEDLIHDLPLFCILIGLLIILLRIFVHDYYETKLKVILLEEEIERMDIEMGLMKTKNK